VRYLDVRLRVVGDELLSPPRALLASRMQLKRAFAVYHGPRPQRSNLRALLDTLHLFLTTHPTETLILSIKEEIPPFHPHFSCRIYEAFKPYLSRWFLEERIPTLGEVRGRGILLTRFERQDEDEWPEGMGIHPSTWPDSRREGFEWVCGGTRVRTQDWYVHCSSIIYTVSLMERRYRVKTFLEIPEKFDTVSHHWSADVMELNEGKIVKHLIPTISSTKYPNPFTLSYTSASYFPLSLPTIIAKGFGWPDYGLGVYGINTRLMRWILERLASGEKVRGCCIMDFYRQTGATERDGEGLAEVLVMMNFLD